MTELRRLREKAPTTSELRCARDYLIGQLELSLESTENQMNWVAEQLLGFDKIIPPDQIKDRCAKSGPATSAAPLRIFSSQIDFCLSLVSLLKTAAIFENG